MELLYEKLSLRLVCFYKFFFRETFRLNPLVKYWNIQTNFLCNDLTLKVTLWQISCVLLNLVNNHMMKSSTTSTEKYFVDKLFVTYSDGGVEGGHITFPTLVSNRFGLFVLNFKSPNSVGRSISSHPPTSNIMTWSVCSVCWQDRQDTYLQALWSSTETFRPSRRDPACFSVIEHFGILENLKFRFNLISKYIHKQAISCSYNYWLK